MVKKIEKYGLKYLIDGPKGVCKLHILRFELGLVYGQGLVGLGFESDFKLSFSVRF